MYEQVEKTEKKSHKAANAVSQMQKNHAPTSRFVDNRPEAIQMRKIRDLAKDSPQNAKLRELHHLAAAHTVIRKQSNVKPETRFVDNRSETVAQRALQNTSRNETPSWAFQDNIQLKCKICSDKAEDKPDIEDGKHVIQKGGGKTRHSSSGSSSKQTSSGSSSKQTSSGSSSKQTSSGSPSKESKDQKEGGAKEDKGGESAKIELTHYGCYSDDECSKRVSNAKFCHNCVDRGGSHVKWSGTQGKDEETICFPCRSLGKDEEKQKEKISSALDLSRKGSQTLAPPF